MEIFKRNNRQDGVSLIITFFIMTIILAVVLAISTILYSQIKIIRDIGNSVISFYAADSGIEKVLYYDRHVLPILSGDQVAVRGLCSMTLYDPTNNPNACQTQTGANNPVLDSGIFCNGGLAPVVGTTDPDNGCDPSVCDDCTISFSTTFPDNEKSYVVNATIVPGTGGDSSVLTLDSAGNYENITTRKIELSLKKTAIENVIYIEGAQVLPDFSVPHQESITISANLTSTYGINQVQAHIKKFDGTEVSNSPVSLLSPTEDAYGGVYDNSSNPWTGPIGTYYVEIDASDIEGNNATPYDIQLGQ